MNPSSVAPADFRVQQKKTPGSATSRDGKPVPALFHPLKIRGVTFANRIQVSPMCMYSAKDGFATDFHLVHAGQFALRGAGLFMVEATSVTPEGRISPQCLGLWSDDHIAPLARVSKFYKDHGGAKIGIQIGHAGRKAGTWPIFMGDGRKLVPKELGGWPNDVVGPSPVAWGDDMAVPHELAVEQIEALVEAFKAAAVRADKAGFDVVELHGAHGYLIHQFLSPLSNLRTDAYGGALPNRAKFLVDIVKAVRSVWPEDKPLFVRLSCTDWNKDSTWDIDEVIEVVKILAPLGVDVIDCSSGGAHQVQDIKYGRNFQVPFAKAIRDAVPAVKTVAVGTITEAEQANEIVADGHADFAMLAREFLRDDWTHRAGRALGCDVAFVNQYERGAW